VSALHISLRLATRLLEAAISLVVLGYLLLALGLLTLRYAVLPNAQQFVPWLEQGATQALGLRVHIDTLQSRWSGLLPTLELRGLVIDNPQGQPALRFGLVQAQPSWKSLPRLRPVFEQIVVDGAQIGITRTDATHLDVGGIRFDLSAPGGDAAQRFADWLVTQDQILILHSQLTWTDRTHAAAPLLLRDVNVELRSSLLRHRAALRATLPASLGAPFEIRADFHQPLFAAHAADFARWHGQFWVDLPRVDLGALAAVVPLPPQLGAGSGALRAWLGVDTHYRLGQSTLLAALRDARLQLDPALPPLQLASLSGRLDGSPLPGGLQFKLTQLQLATTDGLRLDPLDASFSTQSAPGSGSSGSLGTSGVDLRQLAALALRLPLPADWRQRLLALQPQGRIGPLQASWQTAAGSTADTLPETYKLQATFKGLGWSASNPIPTSLPAIASGLPPGLPGLHGLNGSLQADEGGGRAQLAMPGGSVELPTLFDAPSLPLQQFATDLSWSRQPDAQWSVQTSNLQLSNADAAGSASLHYTTQAHGPGLLELSARLTRADARAVPRYLPLAVPQPVRDYLRSAIAAGSSHDVRFTLQGALADFPFVRPGSGVFDIAATVENGVFNAAPLRLLPRGQQAQPAGLAANAQWPVFTDVGAQLDFTGRGMTISAAHAQVENASVQRAALQLPDWAHPVLQASGQAQGDARDALRYLRDSPLEAMLGGAFGSAQASGPLRLQLALTLPLADLDHTTVKGHLELLGASLDYLPELPPFQNVRGHADFTERGFVVQAGAQGFLGGPVQLAGGQPDGRPLALTATALVSAQGLQAAPRLRRWSPWLQRLSGQTRVRASIGDTATGLQLQSNLAGLGIDLPAPLGKGAAQIEPLQLRLSPGALPQQTDWQFSLGDALRAHLLYGSAPRGGSWLGGAVALGSAAELAAPAQGMQVDVQLPSLDLDAWRQALEPELNAHGADDSDLLPRALTMKVGSMKLAGRGLDHVSLSATRSGTSWQATLESAQLGGRLGWQMGQGSNPGSFEAHLGHLSLPESADSDVERVLADAPSSLPALNIVADEIDLHGHHFRHLELQASNHDVGAQRQWRLNNFVLAAPEGTLSGSGSWDGVAARHAAAAPRRLSIAFKLALDDAGGLLARLGKPGLLKGGKGTLHGTLSWTGSPLTPDYPSMSGAFSLQLGKGQFLKADPGIAKLLGVLSLQSLPRRLLFNFRDVFESGFAFDRVDADVAMQQGIATTHNFKMQGVAATVAIEGTTDLAKETQDLYVVVVPEINAGSASLAYALVNPAIGLGTFIAQFIARKPLMKAFTYGYRVSGTWTKPEVRQVAGGAPAAAASAPVVPTSGATAPQ
jgi:uncharacterized protein (TIGR02099 family)